MEFVDGQPLSDRLARRDPMTLGEIVSILDQTSQALGAAHSVGIVHRDVKPGNLLLTPDGRVKVTDFGIARAINSADITEVGQVIGTARYMSPEQARGEEATPASDIYSLAVIGYEMLSGRTPFAGDSPVAIALAHVQTAPPALPASVPVELRSLIERSLGKLAEHRPSDGASFASALQRIAIDPAPATVGATTWSARLRLRRSRAPACNRPPSSNTRRPPSTDHRMSTSRRPRSRLRFRRGRTDHCSPKAGSDSDVSDGVSRPGGPLSRWPPVCWH